MPNVIPCVYTCTFCLEVFEWCYHIMLLNVLLSCCVDCLKVKGVRKLDLFHNRVKRLNKNLYIRYNMYL